MACRASGRDYLLARLARLEEGDCNTYVTAVCDVGHGVVVMAEIAFSPYSMRVRTENTHSSLL
jgi:hypothetical protein